MAEQSLGLESVPFFKKPLDASESDRIVGQDDAGNFVYQTFLGNRYTVARDPDQRTTRTKIEEDVIPAVKAYAENPRLPTGEEVVGAGKAIVEGAVETASIPGDLLTGKRSPTSVQMGDAFDIAGGAAVGAGLQTLPDNAVGSMVGAFRRKEKPDTELAFPSPRLEQKTDTSFSYPTQTINLSGPISSYVETMNIPKKGITANNFLKEIRNNLNVPVRVFPDSFVDSSKRYTREELLDLVEQKEFKVKAQEQEMYQGTQRQNEAGFTYGDEQEYFFMNIAATTGAGKITPRRQHSSRDDIGHVRGSIITPNVNSPYSNSGAITEFNDVTENKPFLLAEEFQSDLYQKGYKKTNPKFMQEAVKRYYSGRSPELQKVIADSSLAANKINLPAVNDYGYIRNNTMILTDEAIERTMKDATERGYIGGDTFDSISFSVDRLKGVETDEVFKPAYLDTKRIENTVRMLAEKGVSINLPETEVFRAEMFVPPSVDVETIFKVDPLSLSNSSFASASMDLNSNPQVLFRVQSMDPDTAEIFNTTTIGELNAATQEWLESLSRSAQSQGFVPSLIEDAVRNETNAERMGRGDFISADDIGGRSGGTIGEPGTISEFAENLVRKKLGLDFTENAAGENLFSLRYVNYPDNTDAYYRLINTYSDLIYEQISSPEADTNVLGKLSATKKTNDEQIKKLEDYITKTTQGILDYRTKIVDQENKIDKHFEKFVSKLDRTEVTSEQAKGLLRAAYTDLKRNTNDFQGLDAVTPPINKVKSVTDEMLKILIVKAATSGVDKIVIPPTDRIAAIRFRDHRASPEKFTQIYDEGIPASIQELKQNYPEVIVTRDVEMPYDNSMYPPGYNDIPSNQGTVIDLEAFFKKYDVSPDGSVRQFAQGGVAMKDQMEMNFGQAETVDPVSGNDVPPGSLPEEVRDDIPARLSEGEYVVPADVVRYYGVKFFEDLRDQAKMGLQQMDKDGRIGGEPIETSESEVDIDDLIDAEINNMNEGGVVSGYRTGGYGTRGSYGYGYRPTVKEIVPEIQTVPDMPEVVKPVETKAVSGFTGVKIYYNAQGLQVPIQFQNGQPVGGQQALKGLFEKNPMDEGPSETIFGVNPVTGTPYKNQRESEEAELEGRAEVISKYDFNDPELLDKIEKLKKGSIEDNTFLSSPLSFLIPGTGLIKTFTAVTNQSNNNAQIRATAQIAKERGYESLSEQILEKGGIKGKGKGFLGLLSSSDKADKYVQEIQDAATRIISGKELPFVGDPADEKTKVKEGLSRADFAPDELGEAAFRKSMQASAPEGYTYVPGTTNIIPSSKVTSTVDTGVDLISSTKTTPSRSVTTQGYYQKGDDYATGYVGGKKEKGLVRPKLRPSPTDDTPTISGSSSVKGAYVTNAVDSYGNKIRTGTGVAAGVPPDTTYSYSNPKPGSVKDKQDKASTVSTPTTSTSGQSGTGWFRGEDESGNTGSSSSKGGYSCYVATALNVNGYWNITKKVRLLKWCIDTKPEGKLDTLLWRNGYCVFGKKIIAPHVHNKYIQWLSDGFYESTVKNKNNIQATLGKLFFYVPSYTIGLVKALTGNLKTIDRT